MVDTIPYSINGVAIIFMAILIGFMEPTINCQLQDMMKNSVVARQLALFVIIYFTISLSSKSDEHPMALIGNALVIYFGYILLTKQNKFFIILNLLLIMIMFTCIQIRDHHTKVTKDEDKIERYEKIINYSQWMLVAFVLIGFIVYAFTQIQERGISSAKNAYESFKPIQFLFGTKECDFVKRKAANSVANVVAANASKVAQAAQTGMMNAATVSTM
jgi:hypothetical protein